MHCRPAFFSAREIKSKVTLLHVVNEVPAEVGPRLKDPLVRGISEKLESLVPKDIRSPFDVTARVDTGTP